VQERLRNERQAGKAQLSVLRKNGLIEKVCLDDSVLLPLAVAQHLPFGLSAKHYALTFTPDLQEKQPSPATKRSTWR